jgi:hypothetical protein
VPKGRRSRNVPLSEPARAALAGSGLVPSSWVTRTTVPKTSSGSTAPSVSGALRSPSRSNRYRRASDFPIVVHGVAQPVTLYRGCHGGEPEDLLAAMRSNYASGRRPHPADLRAAVLVMAVSMFEDAAFVRRVARARPESVGTHVAEVELRPGRGLCRADTGSAGHWSIWGVPERLVDCIVDVVAA